LHQFRLTLHAVQVDGRRDVVGQLNTLRVRLLVSRVCSTKPTSPSSHRHTCHITLAHQKPALPFVQGYHGHLGATFKNQAQSEYKHVLTNILRSRDVARTPPLEARSPRRRSNVENAPIDGQLLASQPRTLPIYGAQFLERPSPVTRQSPASSACTPRRAFALCRHITG